MPLYKKDLLNLLANQTGDETEEWINQFGNELIYSEQEVQELKNDFYHEKVQLTERLKREINRWKELQKENQEKDKLISFLQDSIHICGETIDKKNEKIKELEHQIGVLKGEED